MDTELTPGIRGLVTIILVSINGHPGVSVKHEAHCHLSKVEARV